MSICERCKKVVAGICVGCTCGGFFAVAAEPEPIREVTLFTRNALGEQPHTHDEQKAPLPDMRTTTVGISTSVNAGQQSLIWSPIPRSIGPSSAALMWSTSRST
jgi:hypothetical protein